MANTNINSYEEARKQRLQDNLKRFEDLGISNISKCLVEVAKLESNSPVFLGPRYIRRSSGRRASYGRRPFLESVASYGERMYALDKAEKLQSTLKSGHPSFVKSMVRSHVSSCFWLGLPSPFCKEHLPSNEQNMVLEDEDGLEHDVIYIRSRTGLSGGWKGFALDHELNDGDALVFELSEPARFKVYIVKASEHLKEEHNDETLTESKVSDTNISIESQEPIEDGNGAGLRNIQQEIESKKRAERAAKRARK